MNDFHNPYTKERNIIINKISVLLKENKSFEEKISWCKKVSEEYFTLSLKNNEQEIIKLKEKISFLEVKKSSLIKEKRELETEMEKLKEEKKSKKYSSILWSRRLSPTTTQMPIPENSTLYKLYKCYKERGRINSFIKAFEKEIGDCIKRDKKIEDTKLAILQEIKNTQKHSSNIENKRRLFIKTKEYLPYYQSEIKKNQKNINELKIEVRKIELSERNFNDKLSPTVRGLQQVENEITNCKYAINRAEYYNEKLNDAENSYGRFKVHQECENELNDSSPQRIIQRKKKDLKSLRRSREKLQKRVNNLRDKLTRKIDEIIIDGSNLCYKGGDKFIGLNALKQLLPILGKKYRIFVVFDNSIQYHRKFKNINLEKEFHFTDIEIHIVAQNQKADETILNLASNKENTFVLSNDKFIEFPQKEVVKNKRIITHEIISNRIIINDLDIDIHFKF